MSSKCISEGTSLSQFFKKMFLSFEAASQLQDRIARAFSSNSLVNTMEMTAAIQYILTAPQSSGPQDYFKKSRMTILGLAGVLFCENEQT